MSFLKYNKFCFRFVATPLFLLLGLFVGRGAQAEIVDRVVAAVNGDPITQMEVDKRLAMRLQELKKIVSEDERAFRLKVFREKALDEIIQEKLLKNKIASSGILVSDEELSAEMAQFLKENGLTKSSLEAELARNGVAYEEFTENMRDQLKQRVFLGRTIRPQVEVSDADLMEYYNERRDSFQGYKSIHFAEILFVPESGRDLSATFDLAQALRDDIASGKRTFTQVAREYSRGSFAAQGGDSGWVAAETLKSELRQFISRMKKGELSQPLMGGEAVLVLKFYEGRESYALPFDDVRAQLQSELFNKKMQASLDQYLLTVRQEAYIQVFD